MPDPATPYDTQIAELQLKLRRAQYEGEHKSLKSQLYILEHQRHLYIQQLTRPGYMYMQDWDSPNSSKKVTLNFIPASSKIVFDTLPQIIDSDPQDDDNTKEEHTDMADMYTGTSETTDRRPFHQRMAETKKASHLWNVINYLHHNIRQCYSFPFDSARTLVDRGTDDDKAYVAKLIQAYWTNAEIDSAHYAVCQTYNKRVGRPPGSKDTYKRTRTAKQEASKALDDITGGIIGANINPVVIDNPPQPAQPTTNNTFNEADLKRVVEALGQSLRTYIDEGDGRNFNLIKDLTSHFLSLTVRVDSIVEHRPTIVELKTPEMPTLKAIGLQHRNFPLLLRMCNARERDGHRHNIWLHGPAGTGKTTAAKQVAKALNLKFYGSGSMGSKFEATGFFDARGQIVSTFFREAWINGGVCLLDEIDGSTADALLGINGPLATGDAMFPDGIFARHPDCIIIAGANTTGLGGTIEYVGRMKQDASSLDRFTFLEWPIDEALEDALCANKEWAATVRKYRANLKSGSNGKFQGVMITPRATFKGESLLAAGLTLDQVCEAVIFKGMSATQRKIVTGA